MDYNESLPKKQTFFATNYTNCAPRARCKNHQKCSHCRNVWRKNLLSKYLGHISDRDLKRYQHVEYITINPTEISEDYELKNARLNDYIKSLTNSGARRSKRHPLHNAEYIIMREITKTAHGYHPHLNIIVLRDHQNHFDDQGGEYRAHVEKISRTLSGKHSKHDDKLNPLTQNVRNIFVYSLKADESRLTLERQDNLSKGKRDVFISSLFKVKSEKSHNCIPIHIQEARRALFAAARRDKAQALREHSAFKIARSGSSARTIHEHALKIARRIERIESKKQKALSKLKPRRRRSARRTKNVHTTKKRT